jgi:hypothetical protein
LVEVRCGFTGLGGGDGVAGGLDLLDVVAELAVDVEAGLVVAGAAVGEPGVGVSEQVPVALRPPCG